MGKISEFITTATIASSITGSLFCLHQCAVHVPQLNPYHHVNMATPSSIYCTSSHPYPPVGGMCTQIGFIVGQYCNPGLDCPGLNGGANGGFPNQYPARR